MGLVKPYSSTPNQVLALIKTVDGTGSGLDADLLDGKHASELDYTLPAATSAALGGVKIGSGIAVAADGTISASGGGESYTLPAATSAALGGVKIGSGVTVAADGKISVNQYTLPAATAATRGGVKIGSGVTVAADGKISVDQYTLPAATAAALGGVKIGSGVTVAADGTISVNQYSLPEATASTLGGVKIGSGLSILNGLLSVSGGGSSVESGSYTGNEINSGNYSLTLNSNHDILILYLSSGYFCILLKNATSYPIIGGSGVMSTLAGQPTSMSVSGKTWTYNKNMFTFPAESVYYLAI